MCGRTACALGPDVICRACSYYDPKTNSHQTPVWKDHPQNPNPPANDVSQKQHQYYPSANIPPTAFTPVLFKDTSGENVIQPMMWGLIPPWHKGEAKSHKMSTNNCRLEGLKETKLYRRSLNERRVCVVLAQGFYEWKTVGADKKAVKQPYFIYMPQNEEFKHNIADESIWNNAEWNKTDGWKGPNILKLAGLYDVWKSEEGEPVYSYTIFTMGSNVTLSWLHDRMPAILETPEQVEAWLNVSKETDVDQLISILKPASKLEWYLVDTKVNNARCHDMDCSKPKPVDEKTEKSKSLMANWLKKGQSETVVKSEGEAPEKKPKVEENK